MRQISLVVHNVRSALNVGSILRTAEGFGVKTVYLTGYTPYPQAKKDERLAHQARKTALQIHKTALGAEFLVNWHYTDDLHGCIKRLKSKGSSIIALEQTKDATNVNKFRTNYNVALIVGNELTGLEKSVLEHVDMKLQIPMSGRKESFNVAVAAGVALYHLRYVDT